MAEIDLNQRLVKATKKELLQIVQSLIRAKKDTSDQVLGLINYIDGQKAPVAASKTKRRSSRNSTRASSEASQDSGVQVHPLLQDVLKTSELDLEICENCMEPFEEIHNTQDSCSRHHPGHWLIEVEGKGSIVFTPASTASNEVIEAGGDWVMSCCSASKEDPGPGCVGAKHVAMTAKDDDNDHN